MRITDFNFGASIGAIDGVFSDRVFGSAEYLIADGSTFLHPAQRSNPYFSNIGAILEVVSDNAGDDISGVGARKVEIRGLANIGGTILRSSEVLDMDGVTPVSTSLSWVSAVVDIDEVGASTLNQGTVTLQTVGGAETVDSIPAFTGTCNSPIVFAGSDEKIVLYDWGGSFRGLNMPGTVDQVADFQIWANFPSFNGLGYLQAPLFPSIVVNASGRSSFQRIFNPYLLLDGWGYVYIKGGKVSTDSINISGTIGAKVVKTHEINLWIKKFN